MDDVLRVYDKYIKEKPYVATSFVPRGETDLAAENSVPAHIDEEDITQATSVAQVEDQGEEDIPQTPSAIDRSIEPPLGPDPLVTIPAIWTTSLSNGLEVYGIGPFSVPFLSERSSLSITVLPRSP